jgi:hypothetical protein
MELEVCPKGEDRRERRSGSSPSGEQEPPPETGGYKRGEGVALLLQKNRSHHLKQEAIRGEKEWLFSIRSTGATT